jgi:hypothetical protein
MSSTTITPGAIYTRPDGAFVRVDMVRGGQVYFVAWHPGEDYGQPKRMTVELFGQAIVEAKMVREP